MAFPKFETEEKKVNYVNHNREAVHIILVNYNCHENTEACIKSIFACNYLNYKVYVVDNDSTDDSYSYLKVMNNINVISSKTNLGFGGGVNLGITYALKHGADYILLLNNDTVVEPDFLTELVRCSKRHSDKAAVGAKIYYESQRDTLWYAGGKFSFRTARSVHVGENEIDEGKFDEETEVSFITGCCILLHKSIIEKTGFMPEDYFLYCEDLAYSIELLKAGFKLVYNPKAVIYHKVSASAGRDSEMSVYYSVRNKLYIIKEYIGFPWRALSRAVFLLENMKRTACGRYELKAVLKGYRDYFKGIKGAVTL